MKLYVHPDDDESIVTRDGVIDHMKEKNIDELQVELAKKMPFSTGIFYCRAQSYCFDKSEADCGKSCPDYAPRNGKSGICRHQRHAYESTGQFETIRI